MLAFMVRDRPGKSAVGIATILRWGALGDSYEHFYKGHLTDLILP